MIPISCRNVPYNMVWYGGSLSECRDDPQLYRTITCIVSDTPIRVSRHTCVIGPPNVKNDLYNGKHHSWRYSSCSSFIFLIGVIFADVGMQLGVVLYRIGTSICMGKYMPGWNLSRRIATHRIVSLQHRIEFGVSWGPVIVSCNHAVTQMRFNVRPIRSEVDRQREWVTAMLAKLSSTSGDDCKFWGYQCLFCRFPLHSNVDVSEIIHQKSELCLSATLQPPGGSYPQECTGTTKDDHGQKARQRGDHTCHDACLRGQRRPVCMRNFIREGLLGVIWIWKLR